MNSWREETQGQVSSSAIDYYDTYFNASKGRRGRSSSVDSTGSLYEDVYPIEDESQLDFSEDEPEPVTVVPDSLSYNPYINVNSLRGGGPPLIYRLVAVIHHLGSGMGGHYMCFRRIEDKWYLMNDQIVKEVTWSEVNTNHIYMAEYELTQRN